MYLLQVLGVPVCIVFTGMFFLTKHICISCHPKYMRCIDLWFASRRQMTKDKKHNDKKGTKWIKMYQAPMKGGLQKDKGQKDTYKSSQTHQAQLKW